MGTGYRNQNVEEVFLFLVFFKKSASTHLQQSLIGKTVFATLHI